MRAKQLFSKTHDLTNSKRFVAALILLQAKAPAYYAILAGLDIIWTDKVKTAATDGCYIYINPEFFRGLANDSQRAFLLGHEVGHVVLRHPIRGKFYGDRGFFAIKNGKRIRFDYKLYNKAADYVINADLIAHGLEFIPSGLLSEDVRRNDLVVSVYAGLRKENEERQEQPQKRKQLWLLQVHPHSCEHLPHFY